MQRAFGYITIGASAQPLISTTLAAAVAPSILPDSTQQTTLQVASSAIFVVKDTVVIGLVSGTSFTNVERAQIVKIPDATHITVQGLSLTHAANELVVLSIPVATLSVQSKDGNTGAIGIGTGPGVNLTTGVQLLYKLATVAASAQPNVRDFTFATGINGINTSDLWIVGTQNDTYLPSATIL